MKTWTSVASAMATGVSGWFLATAPYILRFQGEPEALAVILLSSTLVWFSFYFALQLFVARWNLSSRVLLSTAAYLASGALAVVIAVAVRPFSGILILVPFWPLGVVFILFSERAYDPLDPVFLFLAISLAIVVSGLLMGVLRRLQIGKEIEGRERRRST